MHYVDKYFFSVTCYVYDFYWFPGLHLMFVVSAVHFSHYLAGFGCIITNMSNKSLPPQQDDVLEHFYFHYLFVFSSTQL